MTALPSKLIRLYTAYHHFVKFFHSEVVEVCTSSTLKTNSLTDSTCDESSEFKSVDEGSNKVHFSIGKAPLKEEQEMRASPKISRKCANRHTRPKTITRA